MTLANQAARRVELARQMGREPIRWIASDAAADELAAGNELHGVPLMRGTPRSDWGLELILAPRRG